jgi:four helix bundle protein
VSQARRAAVSIALNLVEGSSKLGPREFARFADISIGSLAELAYLLRFAHRLGYIDQPAFDRLEELRSHTARLTWKLVRSLRAAKV